VQHSALLVYKAKIITYRTIQRPQQCPLPVRGPAEAVVNLHAPHSRADLTAILV
jgi:hypothetical protein